MAGDKNINTAQQQVKIVYRKFIASNTHGERHHCKG